VGFLEEQAMSYYDTVVKPRQKTNALLLSSDGSQQRKPTAAPEKGQP
jgi:hypothetical protein